MDIIIEDNVLYRDRKKWMKRLCKLARTNNFSDSVKLLVCTADDGKTKRGSRKLCTPLLSKHVIYGHLHGIHMGNQSNVMYIVCKSTVECLAFEDFETMKHWSDLLGVHLRDISQFVDLIYADKHSQLKSKLEGRLFFNCSHISFIRSPSTCEPKLLMSWKIADIVEYGSKSADSKSSLKGKSKNSFSDDNQNLFIMRVSPVCQRAPNIHIFSCKEPTQFCNWMENLASNQENLITKKGFELMSQRSRTESYCGFARSRTESEYSPGIDGGSDLDVLKTNKFFAEAMTGPSRMPRYQRSSSEIRHRRLRLHSEDGIQEKEEMESGDPHERTLSQSDGAAPCVIPSTLTWLERYPYERERGRNGHVFSRQMSEGAPVTTCPGSIAQWPIDGGTLPRPKSSNNYCSLLNLRQRNDSSSNQSSPLYQANSMSSSPVAVDNNDKDRGSNNPHYVNISGNILGHPLRSFSAASPYANVKFDELIQEISNYCMAEECSVQFLQYADLTFEHHRDSIESRDGRISSAKVTDHIHNNNIRYIHIDIHNTMVLKSLSEAPMFPASVTRHTASLASRRCLCM